MVALTFSIKNLQRSWSVCFRSSVGVDGSLVTASMGPGTVSKIRAMKLAKVARIKDRLILPLIACSYLQHRGLVSRRLILVRQRTPQNRRNEPPGHHGACLIWSIGRTSAFGP